MPIQEHRRSKGKCLLYSIEYDRGEYFIQRGGVMKKAVSDAVLTGILPQESTPDLMRHTAIADIEDLIGMDE